MSIACVFHVKFFRHQLDNVPMSSLSRFELKSPDHTCSLASKSYFHRLFRGSNTFRMLLFNVSYIRERSFLQIFDRWRLKPPGVRAVTARFVPFCPFLRFILFQKDNCDRKSVHSYCFKISKAKFVQNSEIRAFFAGISRPTRLGAAGFALAWELSPPLLGVRRYD